jgi:hypothetical protein
MVQDSDDPLFVASVVVWVLVVILAIVALHCPLPRRIVRWCTIWCNKSAISLLGLIKQHFLVFPGGGTLQVSLVTNRPEECTYLPPLAFGFSGYSLWHVGIRVARQPGIRSYSSAVDVRPAHWLCVWSCSRLWWIWSTSWNERQTVALERSLDVPSVWVRFTLARLKFDSGIVRFSRRLRLLDFFAT